MDWVSYQQRRSEGGLKYTDDGEQVTIVMDVAGCGQLVFTVNAKFSALLNQVKWDQTAELRARLTDVV